VQAWLDGTDLQTLMGTYNGAEPGAPGQKPPGTKPGGGPEPGDAP
jgi:hypothetical protein